MKIRFSFVVAAAALLTATFSSIGRAALTVLGYQPQLHDRFYVGVDKDFIGDGYDWSGVARGYRASEGVHKRWATMISETHFLSANHFHPDSGDELTFFRTDDPAGDSWTGEVSGGIRIGDSDLWLGSLDNAPPAWVARYPIVSRPEAMHWPSYISPEVFIIGQSGSASAISQRLGRNEISRADYTFTMAPPLGSFESHGPSISWTYDIGANGLGDDEAWTEGGDSGGPTFAITPSGLAILGIHLGNGVDSDAGRSAGAIAAVLPSPDRLVVVTDLIGDINGDYRVDGSDYSILGAHWEQNNGVNYNDGDINLDGSVDGSDLAILSSMWQQVLTAPSDFNKDMRVNRDDIRVIGEHWLQNVPAGTLGDANGDGVVDGLDMDALNANWKGGFEYIVPDQPMPADFYPDGLIDGSDRSILLAHWQTAVDPFTNGDINGDGFVDGSDYSLMSAVWDPYGPADINEDYRIDNADLAVLVENWNAVTTLGKQEGDLDGDGFVDANDFSIMADWWGRNVKYMDDQPPLSSIPEPAAIWTALIAMVSFAGVSRGKPCRDR